MDEALKGQVAIVTGAASGIGRATAHALAAKGVSVALVDLAAEGISAVAGELGAAARVYPTDLSHRTAIPALVQAVLADFGRIDILVNSAGVALMPHSSIEFTDAQLDMTIAVNLVAPLLLIREVGQHMIARGKAGDAGGRIVNVSSSAGTTAAMTPAIYAASKGGLNALTRTSAADLGPHGVNVNAVAPGATRTEMMAAVADYLDGMVKQGPLANLTGVVSEAEDVANVITFLCLPESRQMTGQILHTSAGAVV